MFILIIAHLLHQIVKKAQTCRYDWHQTGSVVVVAFYAKACVPAKSSIMANRTNVCVLYMSL